MRAVVLLIGAALLLAAAAPARAAEVDTELTEAEALEAVDALDLDLAMTDDLEADAEADAEDELDDEDDAEEDAEAEAEDDAEADADVEAEAEAEGDDKKTAKVAPAKPAAAKPAAPKPAAPKPVAATPVAAKPAVVTPTMLPAGALVKPVATCQYVTAASSAVSLTAVSPRASDCGGGAGSCATYTGSLSCLGTLGPIGALGPLGLLGPIGSNAWNPSAWMGAAGDWSQWQKQIAANSANPLSAVGPLGTLATLATSANDFMKHLSTQGVWTVLGPVGPLGALGPLGPLGPMGIHGFKRDPKTGAYKAGNAVQRTFTAAWDAHTQRTWELVEYYPDVASANAVADQDTSFAVDGTIMVDFLLARTTDVIAFTSKSDQFVTVTAVPHAATDLFNVEVKRVGGGLTAASREATFVNYVQFRAAAGAKYQVTVELGATARASPVGFPYRLIVTGSTPLGATPFVTGPHIHKC